MTEILLPTTVVGSYPQPDWLVDRALLSTMVPRVRRRELWRVAEPYLAQAQDDATLIAIREQERAGIDIITDGEMRRESYSNRFATALEGIDNENPAKITNRAGRTVEVPRVVGKVRRLRPVEVEDMAFLRRNTERKAKITLPGPFTMAQQAKQRVLSRPRRDDHGLRRRGERRGARPRGGRCRRDPARRAVAAQRSGRGEADRHQGDRPCARRTVGTDGRASVLRLCRGGAGQKPSGYSFLPQLADCAAHADLDRGGAAQARSRHSARSRRQDRSCSVSSTWAARRSRRRRRWRNAFATR